MKLLRTIGRGAGECRRVLAELEQRQRASAEQVEPAVRRIVTSVRKGGDKALFRYMAKFDRLPSWARWQVSPLEMKEAWEQTAPTLREALQIAVKNIRKFAQRQLPGSWDLAPVPGLSVGQLVRPIDSVGCYVPGGRHPLPSSLLMTVLPAQVAGVRRIVVASPNPASETLAAAHLLGVELFYRMGGAHAIAALAYGTGSLPAVDKIVGPGNRYVTTAKKLVAFDCAIDMLAGPTEIVVISDEGDPACIAAELVAQAEHDPEALAIFITTRPNMAKSVAAEVQARAKSNVTAKQSLARHGYVLLAASVDEARRITNRLAPEHLTVDAEADLDWVRNAGSVFVGPDSPQPMGDYVSGPNHTLPTGGQARVRGGLSVWDFVKLITVQRYDRQALEALGPAAVAIAEAEGLMGHAEAIRARGVRSESALKLSGAANG